MPRKGLEEEMPLLAALLKWEGQGLTSFHTPGHRQGREVADELRSLFGRLWTLDATELPDLDDLHRPRGPIARAQELLAELYGSDRAYFLVGGSTAGLLAGVLAMCKPGDRLLMNRFSHRSAFAAAMLAGVDVRYVRDVVGEEGLPLGPDPGQVVEELRSWRPSLLLLTRPNYYGIGLPLGEIFAACRETGTRLLVDEAHGAHWVLPRLAGAPGAGADLVVQSAHKTLPALTQAAWIHCSVKNLDIPRLEACLRMVQTSSPSYLLMASLDVARWHLARWKPEGEHCYQEALNLREHLRQRGLPVLPKELPPGWVYDPFRLVVDAGALGTDGRRLAAHLRRAAGIEVEWAEPERILLLLGLHPGSEAVALGRVVDECIRCRPGGRGRTTDRVPCYPELPTVLSPAEAWRLPAEWVGVEDARGRVAADFLYLSPPGVPVAVPGELWTEAGLEFVRRCLALGLIEELRLRVCIERCAVKAVG